MSEQIFLTIIIFLIFGVIASVIRNTLKSEYIINENTIVLSLFLLLFSIVGTNLVSYDVKIGEQYKQKNKDAFRPTVIYDVIDINDSHVQYRHIGDNYSFTNSSTIREFCRAVDYVD